MTDVSNHDDVRVAIWIIQFSSWYRVTTKTLKTIKQPSLAIFSSPSISSFGFYFYIFFYFPLCLHLVYNFYVVFVAPTPVIAAIPYFTRRMHFIAYCFSFGGPLNALVANWKRGRNDTNEKYKSMISTKSKLKYFCV